MYVDYVQISVQVSTSTYILYKCTSVQLYTVQCTLQLYYGSTVFERAEMGMQFYVIILILM